jgi:DNA-binding NtrC family response regulator
MAKVQESRSQLKVLYGECDPEILAAQSVSIQKAGHQVDTAVGRKGVEEALRKKNFDLVVLGPTLTKNDRHHLPYMVKKSHAATKVLVMHTDGERHPYVDGNIDTGRSIEDLVAKIAQVISQGAMSKGATAGR